MEELTGSTAAGDSNKNYPTIQDIEGMGLDLTDEDSASPQEEEVSSGDKTVEQQPEHKASEKSIDEILEEMEKGENEEDSENNSEAEKEESSFVIKHDGEIHNLSKEEAIEYAQKGFDYTKKTQALAEREKTLEKDYEVRSEQLKTKESDLKGLLDEKSLELTEYSIVEHMLKEKLNSDPEFANTFLEYFEEAKQMYDNPIAKELRGQLKEMQTRLDEVINGQSENVNKKESELIRERFNSELNDLKENIFPKLNRLGIKIDTEKVKQAWIDGEPMNSSVRQAFDQVYGKQIQAAYESKLKVSRLANKGKQKSAILGQQTGNIGSNKSMKDLSWNQIEQGGWKNFI